MLGVVKNPGAVQVISQNLVQSSNDPSVTQYKIDYWPLQLSIRFSGNRKEGIGQFIARGIHDNMGDVYPNITNAIKAAERNVLAVMTVNWGINEFGPENKSFLGLTNALSGDKAIVKYANKLGASNPSLGPNVVFDWIEYQTEFSEIELAGMLITAVEIKP